MVKPLYLPVGQLQDGPAIPLDETWPLDPHRVAEPVHFPESIRLPYLPSPEGLAGMSTAEIRSCFLLTGKNAN
jgi:hypothetical protein